MRKKKGIDTMKTYFCDYSLVTYSTIEAIVQEAFPKAVVKFDDINEDFFAAIIFFADDLDTLDDLMSEFLWEG
jgi:hypothetical protein